MRLLYTILLSFLCSCSKSQFFYHLINHGVQISTGSYYDPQSGDVTFGDNYFQYSFNGITRTNYTQRSTGGYVEFLTTEVNIDIKVGGNWSGQGTQSDCEVLVNGIYNQSVRLTADDVTETHSILLPIGLKLVRLVNGYSANPSATSGNIVTSQNGVYIQGIITDTLFSVRRPSVVAHKWLFIGNSITTGASGTHPAITGFVGLFRNDGRTIQSDAFGARRLLTVSSSDAHNMAAFISLGMNGIVSNSLFMILGTNNFTVSGGQSKALFKSEYQNFLDSLHAARPDIIPYCISPFNRTTYSTPNSQGATCEDYADAIQELLVTRTWAKFIYGKNLLTLANTVDGLHPNQTGMQEIHDKLLIAYNALQ